MRAFVIDAAHLGLGLRGGVIGIGGSLHPTVEEKRFCVEQASRYAAEGWALAADPFTPLGGLAALVAEAACVRFVSLDHLNHVN